MSEIDYSSVKVGIIEDEPYTRRIIIQCLNQIGIRKVHEAAEGGDGLNMVALTRPDVIFCDIHMEPMGGLKFLENLRSLNVPSISNTPIVFLSADANMDTVENAMGMGPEGYLLKPISPKALKDRIDLILGHQADEQEVAPD